MADVYLGLEGSEVTLPVFSWTGTEGISLPVDLGKQVEERQMSDGTIRYGMFQQKRVWKLQWNNLTKTQLDDLIGLSNLNQTLHFQNNWEDTTWYNVIMFDFRFDPRVITYAMGTTKYRCSFSLREV